MILTPHLLTGAALGVCSPYAIVAFILGIISHFALDALPHWDYLTYLNLKDNKQQVKIAFDLILVCVFAILIMYFVENKITVFMGMLGALLPDGLELLSSIFSNRILKKYSRIHRRIHNTIRLSFWQGLPSLVVIVATMLLLIFLKISYK